MMDAAQLWVEVNGGLIIARIRGVPTEELLRECQSRVLQLVQDTGRGRVLYDALELELPTVDPALIQQKLESELGSGVKLRRAIIVPNTRVAFLARLGFGEGDYRVFYNDISAAIRWLEEERPA
ncbi:SpoIIAA family protein [Occallatibacter riparius]|uniref:STAS/SEC14 domain-containing protein n=1 Tax=Occallatibacter riparius TaxID=1002689 RepID=A0A9J7BMP3_9BACT|nr:STAS/SEC14 domain-containing protein [Occallatibacter riparius]UWZ83955.1 STAS/SEC14 domain-containing protein [Occallatibacter riparius]